MASSRSLRSVSAQYDHGAHAGIIEHRDQIVSVINGHGVRNGGAVDGMLSPEGQRSGGHYVRVVPVGLRYAGFGVIAEAVINGATSDTLLHDRQQHSG